MPLYFVNTHKVQWKINYQFAKIINIGPILFYINVKGDLGYKMAIPSLFTLETYLINLCFGQMDKSHEVHAGSILCLFHMSCYYVAVDATK